MIVMKKITKMMIRMKMMTKMKMKIICGENPCHALTLILNVDIVVWMIMMMTIIVMMTMIKAMMRMTMVVSSRHY